MYSLFHIIDVYQDLFHINIFFRFLSSVYNYQLDPLLIYPQTIWWMKLERHPKFKKFYFSTFSYRSVSEHELTSNTYYQFLIFTRFRGSWSLTYLCYTIIGVLLYDESLFFILMSMYAVVSTWCFCASHSLRSVFSDM